MPRFDRYILSQLLALFGFFALVLVGVYWINRAVTLFDQLIGDGQSALVFLEFSALTLPGVIKMVLPFAAFAATVYGTNRLIADSELVVMQATGFSAMRMARPVLYFGLVVAAMMMLLSHVLVPQSRALLDQRKAEISENITKHFLKERQFLHPDKGVTLYIADITDAGALEGLLLTDMRAAGQATTYTAQRALFVRGDSGPKLIMIDGMAQVIDKSDQRLSVTRFADFTYNLGGLLTGKTRPGRRAEEISTWELLHPTPALIEETRSSAAEMSFEAHTRIADPFRALGVSLIGFGALLQGNYSRFGLWRQILMAVGIMIAIQGVATASVKLGLSLPGGWVFAYLAPALASMVGLALLLWAGRTRTLPPWSEPKAAAA